MNEKVYLLTYTTYNEYDGHSFGNIGIYKTKEDAMAEMKVQYEKAVKAFSEEYEESDDLMGVFNEDGSAEVYLEQGYDEVHFYVLEYELGVVDTPYER